MRTLLLGRRSAEQIRARKFLTGAGHEVETCHDDGWGCAGVHGRCPLDGRCVDVAVAVVGGGVENDVPGVACVMRARVPLVTVGDRARHPINEHATATVTRLDVAALEVLDAVSHDAAGHRLAIEEMIEPSLGDTDDVAVETCRRENAIDVRLTGNVGRARLTDLADAARAAVRAHDPLVRVINVRTTAW